jgi:hypothetical protein
MPNTPDQLIKSLSETPEYQYPHAIIAEMIERREAVIPALLHVLEDARQRPSHYSQEPHWTILSFACYLLAQFREKKAFKPLIALLMLPAKTADELFGDLICEDMGRVLASVYDGDDALLRSLIENPDAYEFARGASAISCYQCLLQAGEVKRKDLEAYFLELLETKLEREPSEVWNAVTAACGDLGFAMLVPAIQRAFEDDLCDHMFYGFEQIAAAAKSGGAAFWKEKAILIDDTIAETKGWNCWHAPTAPKRPMALPINPKYFIPSAAPKVGRNDPCPCGSGKKFKKCCGLK